jgi:putative ribosome biogenesis GTPase RsgA
MACVTLIPKEKSHRLRERIKRLCRRDRTGQSLRELNSGDLLPEEVDRYFVEFQGRAAHCRFRSCRHLHEPGCAIRMAVEAGEIAASRYESYQRLVETTGDSTRR